MATYQLAMIPIDLARVTAGYKNKDYTAWFKRTYNTAGVIHYGVDMTDKNRGTKSVRAPFDMKIVKAGFDTLFGNVIIAVSTVPVDIHNGPKKGRRKLTVRMFHLASLSVKAGQTVKRGTIVGNYGGTGKFGGADHLHVELDTDVNYPQYVNGIINSSNIAKRATSDTTIHPMDVFKIFPGQEFNSTYDCQDDSDYVTLTSSRRMVKARKVN